MKSLDYQFNGAKRFKMFETNFDFDWYKYENENKVSLPVFLQ